MKKYFTPNMTPEGVADLDRRRGLGDRSTNPTNPDILEFKTPWLNIDGTHKGSGGILKDSKIMPLDEKDKVQDLLEYEKKEHGKIPTPAEEEAECSKNIKPQKYTPSYSNIRHYTGNEGGQPKDQQFAVPPALKHHKKSQTQEALDLLKAYRRAEEGEPTCDVCSGKGLKIKAEYDAPIPGGKWGNVCSACHYRLPAEAKKQATKLDDVEKAMTAKNSPRLNPAYATPYDPYAVLSRTQRVPFTPVDYSAEPARQVKADTYKSCAIHGLIYKSECFPCSIYKSTMCKTCGTEMHKSPGGSYSCPSGHV